jgi:DNA-binding winged helix-turn-helix (wHTH) protein
MTYAPSFAFGTYLFVPRRQLLLRNGQVVRVGSRALDLLAAFVQRPGDLLTKRELLEEAWPSTTVVEGNLKVHIAALRRALDDDADAARYIATVNGRGYRFVAPVQTGEAVAALPVAAERPPLAREVQSAPGGPFEGSFEDIIALLANAMPSVVVDLPRDGDPSVAAAPRRVLFIELTPRDETWIEDVFGQRLRVTSATR